MIKVIGHRGAAAYALENTMTSFKAALEEKVYMIETDVHITKDGRFIIFHDNLLNRISDGEGYVENLTLEEVKAVTLKDGSHIPELEEVCMLVKDKSAGLFVEVKSERIALQLYHFLQNYLSPSQFIIGSFLHNQIYELKQAHPEAQTCIIFESYPVDLKEYIYKLNPDYVSVGFESVTNAMVTELKATGKRILFWTIDQIDEINKAISYEPFGIISNDPRKVYKILESQSVTAS